LAGLTVIVDTSVLLGTKVPAMRDRPERWTVSVVTIGELEAGVLLAPDTATRAARLRRLGEVTASVPVLGVDRTVSARYAELRAASGRRPSNDLWIAATALAHDLTLVTADERLVALPLVRATLVR